MSFIQKKNRRWGDRRDGIRVRDVNGLNVIMAGLYPNRTGCEVCLREDLDITELLKYIEKKNASGQTHKTKFFHCMVAMLVRVVNERRYLNRFVRAFRIYERDEIIINFIAKRVFMDKAEEELVNYKAKGSDNIDDVSRFILGEVKTLRKNTDPKTGKPIKTGKHTLTDTINAVASMPRPILMCIVFFARIMDYWGLLPKFLSDGDPAYSTIIVANLGSIKCPSVYHHLNNYGTNSIVMTLGVIRKENDRDVIDITFTADERIADGFYFAKSIKLLQYLCDHPHILDKPFDEDIEADYE